jgi:hypothetical protein
VGGGLTPTSADSQFCLVLHMFSQYFPVMVPQKAPPRHLESDPNVPSSAAATLVTPLQASMNQLISCQWLVFVPSNSWREIDFYTNM